MHQNSAAYQWRRAKGKAGLEYWLHDLRHFYATGLIHTGCDVVTVQRALGHANASVTLSTDSHLRSNADDRSRKAAALFEASAYVERAIKAK
jgi:integrase